MIRIPILLLAVVWPLISSASVGGSRHDCAALVTGIGRFSSAGPTQKPSDPEIDRSPIWAVIYGKYLAFLGKEMFWPDIAHTDRFRIAVVNWPDLASDLGKRLDGRAIAGIPVDIIALDSKELAGERNDFTLLFIGGTAVDSERQGVTEDLKRWRKKGDRAALIVTDGGDIEGHDVAFRRMRTGGNPGLCIAPHLPSLQAKSLELPMHFLQRPCP